MAIEKTRTSISVDAEIMKQSRKQAKKERRSLSAFFEFAADQYLKSLNQKQNEKSL